jgi:threonine aldolase
VGLGAKAISDRVTRNKAQQLAALMRASGSEAAVHGPDSALQRLAKSKKDLLARLILSGALVSTPAHGGEE